MKVRRSDPRGLLPAGSTTVPAIGPAALTPTPRHTPVPHTPAPAPSRPHALLAPPATAIICLRGLPETLAEAVSDRQT